MKPNQLIHKAQQVGCQLSSLAPRQGTWSTHDDSWTGHKSIHPRNRTQQDSSLTSKGISTTCHTCTPMQSLRTQTPSLIGCMSDITVLSYTLSGRLWIALKWITPEFIPYPASHCWQCTYTTLKHNCKHKAMSIQDWSSCTSYAGHIKIEAEG